MRDERTVQLMNLLDDGPGNGRREAVSFLEALPLAIDTPLSACDASYLWLGRRLAVPLVTLDKKLAAHATRH